MDRIGYDTEERGRETLLGIVSEFSLWNWENALKSSQLTLSTGQNLNPGPHEYEKGYWPFDSYTWPFYLELL
jgi:hypothetical protein